MKVPDKIYIGTVTLSSNEPGEQHLLPDWHLRPNSKVANIEYIRKDALLEWAKGFTEPKIFVSTLIDKLNSM